MNRKFYRLVERWSSEALAKDETHRNWPGMKNEFHSLHGAVATSGDATTTALAARMEIETDKIIQHSNRSISDVAVVIKEMVDDRIKSFIDRGNSLLASCIGRTFVSIEGLRTSVDDHYKSLVNCIATVVQQNESTDKRNSERYLKLNENQTRAEMLACHHHDVNIKTQTAMFESLTAQIRCLAVPHDKERFASAPTLEWLIDNMDEIIELGSIMDKIRDNQAPRENTIYTAVKAIRALELFPATDVRDEVEGLIYRWDHDQRPQRLHA